MCILSVYDLSNDRTISKTASLSLLASLSKESAFSLPPTFPLQVATYDACELVSYVFVTKRSDCPVSRSLKCTPQSYCGHAKRIITSRSADN